MAAPVLALQHIACEPPAAYEDELRATGLELVRVELDEGDELPDWRGFGAVVVMGGPMGAYEEREHPWLVAEKRLLREAVEAGVPVWGVCLGAQLLASALGARVYRGDTPEVGVLPVELTPDATGDPVFADAAEASTRSSGTATASTFRPAPRCSPPHRCIGIRPSGSAAHTGSSSTSRCRSSSRRSGRGARLRAEPRGDPRSRWARPAAPRGRRARAADGRAGPAPCSGAGSSWPRTWRRPRTRARPPPAPSRRRRAPPRRRAMYSSAQAGKS